MLVDARTNNSIANDMCLRLHAHHRIENPLQEETNG